MTNTLINTTTWTHKNIWNPFKVLLQMFLDNFHDLELLT